MVPSRRPRAAAGPRVSIADTLSASGLDPRLAHLVDEMPHRIVQVDPKRTFREPGAPRDEAIFVRSGILAKFKTDAAGRRQIVALRFPGETILPGKTSATFGIQAIIRSEVMIIRADDFEALLEKHPDLYAFFCGLIQRDESISYEWLVNCGRRDSTARVAHLLCETAERSGIDAESDLMVNPFTQQQIADITGQTPVNVNRIFADLERQGLIQRHGREIAFSDWAELRRVAGFHPAYLD